MGIYVFDKDALIEEIESSNIPDLDFGANVIPNMIKKDPVFAYKYYDYWQDVGTYDSYLQANLDLIETVDKVPLDMYDPKWKIYTKSEELPAVKVGSKAVINQALLSNGAIVAGTVIRSVLSPGVIVHPHATVKNSVLLNNVEIMEGAYVENAIIDKETIVSKNAIIGTFENIPNIEKPGLLSSGITVLGKNLLVPENIKIGKNCRIFTTAKFDGDIPSGSTLI